MVQDMPCECKEGIKKASIHSYRITIGINYLLRQTRNTDALNDCIRYYVGEINKKDAHVLFKDLYSNQFRELHATMTINNFFKILDCRVPFFIHLFFHQIMQDPAGSLGDFSMQVLERVFWNDLLGKRCKAHFDHYKDRLSRYEEKREKVAELLLKKITRETDFSIKRIDLWNYIKYKLKDYHIDDLYFNDIMGDLEVECIIKGSSCLPIILII